MGELKFNTYKEDKIVGQPVCFVYADIIDVLEMDKENVERVKKAYSSLNDFCVDVDELVCKYFDSTVGITWDLIRTCIKEVVERKDKPDTEFNPIDWIKPAMLLSLGDNTEKCGGSSWSI